MTNPVIIGKATLHLADCMDYMRGLPDKAFDLAIVDPPYGIERFKSNDGGNSKKITSFGDNDKNWNNEKPSEDYWNSLFRVSKYQIIWGANNFSLPNTEYFIVWDKGQMMPSFARCELAWTSVKIPAKIFSNRSQDPQRIHPTQKPVALYEWLMTNYAKPGQRILDTHLGSGSSAIAANNLGYEFVGCELDADYFSAACHRIDNAQRQESLFDPRDAYEQAHQQASLLEGNEIA
jgi:site-specific DNA-methyltransferase (adenine-specific)